MPRKLREKPLPKEAVLRGGPRDGQVVEITGAIISFGEAMILRDGKNKFVHSFYEWATDKNGKCYGKFKGLWDHGMKRRFRLTAAEKADWGLTFAA